MSNAAAGGTGACSRHTVKMQVGRAVSTAAERGAAACSRQRHAVCMQEGHAVSTAAAEWHASGMHVGRFVSIAAGGAAACSPHAGGLQVGRARVHRVESRHDRREGGMGVGQCQSAPQA